jgi:hypothetical protein
VRTNFVLIDAENVKPDNLEKLNHEHYRVVLFVGAKVTSLPFDVANAMQSLGANGQYVKVSNVGPNALDFHIAFYLGQLSNKHPNSCFHIITKDKGFDPLIKHLKNEKYPCSRWETLLELLANGKGNPKQSTNANPKKQSNGNPKACAAAYFSKRIATTKARPATLKTLRNSIHCHFQKRYAEEEITKVVEALKTSGQVVVNGNKVSYPKKT